ncbi:NADH-quinone oxidoreductase subunit M [Streptomyces sp. 3MP-14]|uniref:NADH-quinone oxidoreductase subunit M n=1 Tax=Streptomyces mimosae TaxID=2586635 RepID=A0A5N6AE94_9ACTN|nr:MULTISPECIES: NADH-quinone oxidoreductase subunit M [Streptomyces]KAB8167134.1 NADH-quinone oxidoreductase subunit M [Streptomyces mimosae]KAB8177075.1 NADH-quinone oxidoreductase subunit M [Streptomyces sp. 3MP-14]
MITLSDSVRQALLVAVLALPLVGALAALLPAPPGLRGSGGPDRDVLRHGVTVTGVVLAATVVLALAFDHDRPGAVQAETDVAWVPAWDVRFHLGVDGISLPLLVLTALLTFLAALYSYFRPPTGEGRPGPRAFVALLLLLETGMLATFAVLDLILFFLAFETVLVPMYFLIARWGNGSGAERAAAAWKFVLYTVLGSVLMLLGLLLVGVRAGTFDMVALAEAQGSGLTRTTQILAVLAIGFGLAVKTPMWPLHSWLPDAHTAAPTVGSVLLAGVLLKMGTYGLVRIALPVAPEGMRFFAPYLGAFAVVGIIYGSLACLALVRAGAGGDLKRLIAYSSVGHMGFVLLGVATMTHSGVNGALFAGVAHGLITGLLFFLVGAVKERTGSTDIDALAGAAGAGLYGRTPRLGGLLAFAAVASLGLPGLAGFWGELLAMLGAFHPADGLSRPAFLAYLAVAALGTLLTAAYLLLVVRRICMGPAPAADPVPAGSSAAASDAEARPAPPALPALPDLRGHEYAAFAPLVALTVLAGLWPAVLLHLTDPAVQLLLPGVVR